MADSAPVGSDSSAAATASPTVAGALGTLNVSPASGMKLGSFSRSECVCSVGNGVYVEAIARGSRSHGLCHVASQRC